MATSGQTTFSVPFAFHSAAHLAVYKNSVLLTYVTHYVVTGVDEEAGGSIILVTGAAVSDAIVIERKIPFELVTHIPPSGPLDVPAINIQFALFVMMLQQLVANFQSTFTNITPGVLTWLGVPSSANLAAASGVRVVLSAARTYYVRTDGNDSNTGLIDSAGGAFRTIQSAVNALALLDANQQSVIIQVRSGTYNEDVFLKPILGGGPNGAIILRGDTTTPSNVIINSTANCVFALGSITNDWLVEGFKFTSGIYGVHGHANAWIRVGKVEFGACGTAHVIADHLGTVELQSAYTISGNSTYHAFAYDGGYILNAIVPATLVGTLAFSGSFAASINRSFIEWNGGTFLGGSATGTRYLVNANSVINTAGAGANFFPGDVAGVAGTGGIYA